MESLLHGPIVTKQSRSVFESTLLIQILSRKYSVLGIKHIPFVQKPFAHWSVCGVHAGIPRTSAMFEEGLSASPQHDALHNRPADHTLFSDLNSQHLFVSLVWVVRQSFLDRCSTADWISRCKLSEYMQPFLCYFLAANLPSRAAWRSNLFFLELVDTPFKTVCMTQRWN